MKIMCRLSWMILLCVTVQVFAHDVLPGYLQKEALRHIARCQTERCVDKIVEALDYADPAVRIIQAAKLNALHAASAHAALLDAIPTDPVSFWFAYSVTSPRLESFAGVNELYHAYFPAAAKAVATSGKRVREFLLLQRFADGEIAVLIAEAIDDVARQNTRAYCAARGTLTPSVQRQLRDICKAR